MQGYHWSWGSWGQRDPPPRPVGLGDYPKTAIQEALNNAPKLPKLSKHDPKIDASAQHTQKRGMLASKDMQGSLT